MIMPILACRLSLQRSAARERQKGEKPLIARLGIRSCKTILFITLVFVFMATVTKETEAVAKDDIYRKMIQNLQWVLVTVENLDSKFENPRKLTEQIRQDIRAKLDPFGIRPRFAHNTGEISAASYLWVRVHKIELERTVYLSSVELIVTTKANPGTDTAQTNQPPRYTRVSNQLKTVRQKIEYLLNDLIRDYLR